MLWFALTIAATLALSFACSLCEAFVLSTTLAEVEALKKSHPRRGQRVETMRQELEATISAILTMNTIVNGVGFGVVGNPLLPGRYRVHIDVFDYTGAKLTDSWNDALEFAVRSPRGEIGQGLVDLPVEFTFE